LAAVAREIGIGSYILLGRGETSTGGADKDSILSDTLEALLGAVYLCHGLAPTRAAILNLLGPTLKRAANLGAGLDWKTSLQELVATMGLSPVEYQAEGSGPDHARVFSATVVVDGIEWGLGSGTSKKLAEQRAAENAYQRLSTAAGADPKAARAGEAAPGDRNGASRASD
jgi:ribonuclease-3